MALTQGYPSEYILIMKHAKAGRCVRLLCDFIANTSLKSYNIDTGVQAAITGKKVWNCGGL